MIREAKPEPGSGATVSGSVKRRSRSSGGVGWISPNPWAVTGRGRVPSHGGGDVPAAEPVETPADGELGGGGELGEAGAAGEAEVVELVGASGRGDSVVAPQAQTSTIVAAATVSLLTSQP